MSVSRWGPLERLHMIQRSYWVKITPFMLPHCTIWGWFESSQALHFSNEYETLSHVTDIILLRLIDGKNKGNRSTFKTKKINK